MSDQATPSTQDVTATPPSPPDGNTSPDTNDGKQATEMVTMPPQALKERLERERQKAISTLLGELGLESVDNLQTALNERETLRKEKMTELEQAQSELDKLQAKLAKVSEEKQAIQDQMSQFREKQFDQLRKSTVLRHAQGAQHPEDVLAWVQSNHPDEYRELVDSEGNLDNEKAKALVDLCVEERREWFRLSPYPGSPPTANRGHSDGGILELDEEELKKQGRRSLRF